MSRIGIALAAGALAFAGAHAHAQEAQPRAQTVPAQTVPAAQTPPVPAAPAAPLEVVVTGDSLLPRAAADPTAATTVIEGDDLRVPGQSTAETLSRAPGVQVARGGAAGELATASLRGATTAQTPVYLAGVRLNDDVTGTADLATVPLFWLRRAEVWRGASPVWLDRPGLGGAILLEPELPARSRFGSAAGVGSFGQRFAWIGGSLGDQRAAAAFALRGDSATNDYSFVDDAGTRFDASDDAVRTRGNADLRSGDAWALARLAAGKRGAVTMVLNGFLREQGVTGLSVVPARRARATTRRELVAVSSRTQCGGGPRPDDCVIEVRTSALRTAYQLADPRRELGFGTDAQITRGKRFTQDVRMVVRPTDTLALDTGAGVSSEGVDVTPSGLQPVVARRSASRAHLEAVFDPMPSLQLRAAGMLANETTRGGGTTAVVTAPMARVAARLAPTPWLALFAGGSRYVRVPTLGETFGASAVLRGNPDLQPERGLGAELGVRLEGAAGQGADSADSATADSATAGPPAAALRVSAELTGFARVAEDLVVYRRISLGGVRPFNVGQARVLGGELTGAADLWRHLRAELALTVLDPRDVDAPAAQRDLLPYLARLVVAPGVELYAERPFDSDLVSRTSIAGRLVYRGERVADAAGLIVLPSQTWLDVEATVALIDDRIALRARLANALDDAATDLLGLPLPGRSVHVAAEAWWN